jgi:hypothetical protein
MPGIVTGGHGLVKYAYQTAAELKPYHIARDELTGAWTLTGTVIAANAFLLAQRPLAFLMKAGAWRWPVESWAMAGGTCRARLSEIPK